MDENSQNTTVRFDEGTIEQEAAHLPEPMREDYRWLKAFCREECNRDLHRLVERFTAVGVLHDHTTWSKIIRGRWNRNPHGDVLPSPVISQEKFLSAVQRLRVDVLDGARRGRVAHVLTTTSASIMAYINKLCASDRVNKIGIIVGHTGSQKTATYREQVVQRNHGRTHWFECPENGAMGEFIGIMVASFGYSREGGHNAKRARLFGCIKTHHCLIFDNAQDMWREGETKQPAFSFLRRLQDVTGCTIILSITNTFEMQLAGGLINGYFEQFEGRSGGRKKWLRLPEWAPDEDVLQIAQAFGLQESRKNLKSLIAISREPGRIRRLFEDLQEATLLASAENSKLTMDHVAAARGDQVWTGHEWITPGEKASKD